MKDIEIKFVQNKKYKKFLNSKKWTEIKERLFKERGRVCEECGSKSKICVHHLNYDREGGNELNSDLMVLCNSCHLAEHGDRNHKRYQKIRKRKNRFTSDREHRLNNVKRFLKYDVRKSKARCKDCRYVSYETIINRKDKEGERLPDKRTDFHCNVMDGLNMPVNKMGSCKDFELK